MGAQTTSSTMAGQSRARAGRGRGAILAAFTVALFSLSAGAAAASPVATPPSPQHLSHETVPQQVVEAVVCAGEEALPLPSGTGGADEPGQTSCRNVNGWQ